MKSRNLTTCSRSSIQPRVFSKTKTILHYAETEQSLLVNSIAAKKLVLSTLKTTKIVELVVRGHLCFKIGITFVKGLSQDFLSVFFGQTCFLHLLQLQVIIVFTRMILYQCPPQEDSHFLPVQIS